LNLQPQSHMLADHHHLFSGNLLSNYQQQQQQNLLNINQATSNFNFQQIQIPSLNLQPIMLPPSHNNSIIQNPQQNENSILSSYEVMMMQNSQKAERISPNKSDSYQTMMNSQPKTIDVEAINNKFQDQETRKSQVSSVSKSMTPKLTEALAKLENVKKISPRKEDSSKDDERIESERPSKGSVSTAGSSEQAEIEDEPKSTESLSDSSVTTNSNNRERRRKSITDMISQRNREEKTTKSSKELNKIIENQAKEESEFFARRKKNSERRKNKWQIAQDIQIEEQPRQTVAIEAENIEQKNSFDKCRTNESSRASPFL